MSRVILSEAFPRIEWSDTRRFALDYGAKGASSLAIPRAWTLPFLLMPADLSGQLAAGDPPNTLSGGEGVALLRTVARDELIVRSSVVGESIWDRGSYASVRMSLHEDEAITTQHLVAAAAEVLASANGRPTGLMIQKYLRPATQGEFGNLQRISRTRDQWEVGTRYPDGITTKQRLNSQRDPAADPDQPLSVRVGLTSERLFGSVGAWLNNELLLGRSHRLNCEWVTDNRHFFLVQIDEEDEDISGVNPFQVRVAPAVQATGGNGEYLKLAEAAALRQWDKLQVLEELWEPTSVHRPTLFYLPIDNLPFYSGDEDLKRLSSDFRRLLGVRGIIVRTSVRAGAEKLPNLPRTECMTPEEAAEWCFDVAKGLRREHEPSDFAFVAHRFVASRASAWARAEPGNPMVEINSLWGLPDALQYCPYDIWEVHVPTGVATDYPDYKSDMLISSNDGGWEYVRVKNELARGNSISAVEAKNVASRTAQIADRLGRACHIMWFIGCSEPDGSTFNIPWYWTEAHDSERNLDRSTYRIMTVSDQSSLQEFIAFNGSRGRQALALKPTDLDLMRDSEFLESVGNAASAAQVPIILSGSTLAHAYYQLRKLGCMIVTPSEKKHARVRHSANLGKLVRDKIPEKIAERQEMRITRQVEGELRKGFLFSKLLEEALEVREASGPAEKLEELADLFEVFCAIAKAERLSLEEISEAADQKRLRAGGFDEGLLLLQTAISHTDRYVNKYGDVGDVLGGLTAEEAVEIPFSYFGFMELDAPRSFHFERFGLHLELLLRPDRMEIRLRRSSKQLEFPL